MLFSLASIAMPAQISGTTTTDTELREVRTGAIVHLAAGKFTRTLCPGDYTVSSGSTVSHLSLLAGGHYEIPDLGHPIDMFLSAKPPENGEVRIEARLQGVGSHKIELRAFNGVADVPSASVDLISGQEQMVTWKLKIGDRDRPWAIVAIPDSNLTARQELFGTLRELAVIE
jgi:hypothetical protein